MSTRFVNVERNTKQGELASRRPAPLDIGGADPEQSSLQTSASRVFGSWRNAVMAAGISPEKARVHDPWPPSRILASIKSPARRKRPLQPAELNRHYHPLVAAAQTYTENMACWAPASEVCCFPRSTP